MPADHCGLSRIFSEQNVLSIIVPPERLAKVNVKKLSPCDIVKNRSRRES